MPEQHNQELREAARDFPERARKLANLIVQEADAHSGSAIGSDGVQFYVNISPPPTWDELRGIAEQLENSRGSDRTSAARGLKPAPHPLQRQGPIAMRR